MASPHPHRSKLVVRAKQQMQKTFNFCPLKLDPLLRFMALWLEKMNDWGNTMTDQERINSAMRDACAILSKYLEPGHIRNPNATVNHLIGVLDRPQLAAALERLEHATGRHGLRLVK